MDLLSERLEAHETNWYEARLQSMTALSLYWLSHKPQARDERSNVYSLTDSQATNLRLAFDAFVGPD